MNRYKGPIDGKMNESLKEAILEYQAKTNLIADGRVNFELYASLLDDVQNSLAALPTTPPARPVGTVAPAAAVAAPAVAVTQAVVPSAPFRINLESDRGSRPSYKLGEFLNMSLSLSGDGAVYCYYEDINRQVARIFPNQFFGNPVLRSGSLIRLPSGGFKIRFDQPGRERVACLGADREVVVPQGFKGTRDLTPLPVKSLDEVINAYRQSNPGLVASYLDITVSR